MYIDDELVKVQMELIRASKETFKSLPDPIFSFVDGEEVISRIRNCTYKKTLLNFALLFERHFHCVLSLLGFPSKCFTLKLLLKKFLLI